MAKSEHTSVAEKRRLIERIIEITIANNGEQDGVEAQYSEMLRSGFEGYENMTLDALRTEYNSLVDDDVAPAQPFVLEEMIAWMQHSESKAEQSLAVLIGAEADLQPFFVELQSYMATRGEEDRNPLYVGIAKHLSQVCTFLAEFKG